MNWIVAFTTPIFLAHSSCGVYFLFGGASLLVVAVCVLFMPETRGMSLEDIAASFQRKSRVTDGVELRDGDPSIDSPGLREGHGVSSSLLV